MAHAKLAALLLGTSALAGPAAAQSAPPPAPDQQQEVDISAPGAGGMSGEDIVVIGKFIPNPIRATPSVVSVLSQADISRTGEGDIAGALKRVTGLSVVGGKYVYVRGLGERYSLALLNGLPIPSPEPLKRVVPLDIFPTDLLASTLVQKSYSVNFPGEFGGGVINLTTRAVPEEPFLNIKASVSGDTVTTGQLGYTYYGSRSDWTSFDDGARAIPSNLRNAMESGKLISTGNFTVDQLKTISLDLTNEQTNLIQRNQTIPANMSLGFTGGTAFDIGEDRLGVIASANWSNDWLTRGGVQQQTLGVSVDAGGNKVLNPDQDFAFLQTDNRIQLNGMLGIGYEFGEHAVRFTNIYIRDVLKQARILAGVDLNTSDDMLNKGYTAWYERQLFSSSLVGEFKWNDLRLNLRGTYAKSRRNSPYERVNSYRYDETIGWFNDLRTNGTGSTVSFSDLHDTVWAGAVDVGYKLPVDRPVTLSAGYAYTDNSRDSTRRDFRYTSLDALPDGVSQQRPDFLLAPFNIQAYDIYLTEVSGAAGVAAFEAGLRVHAGYGQVEAEVADGLRLTAGVRYEKGRMFVTPLDLFGTGADTIFETRLENSYWLPAATVTWNFAEGMQLRLAASKTIARPQFRELAPQTYIDTDNNRTSFGNPYLVDSELLNAEARYEWYFGDNERLTVGGFWKKIDRPIEAVSFQQGGTLFTTFANAPEAQLYGAEAEVQKFFALADEGFFGDRRLMVSANYTFTNSKLKVREGDTTRPVNGGGADVPATDYFTDGAALTGQSDHVANLQLGFQRDGALSEQTLMLTYASDRITQRGPGDTPDLIERPGLRLDLVLREEIQIGRRPFEAKLEIRNITGTGYRESQTLGESVIYNNKYDLGTSFALGLTAKF